MAENRDIQITLFIRDEKTGRYTFNPKALKALGIDPAVARELGYPLKDLEDRRRTWLPNPTWVRRPECATSSRCHKWRPGEPENGL